MTSEEGVAVRNYAWVVPTTSITSSHRRHYRPLQNRWTILLLLAAYVAAFLSSFLVTPRFRQTSIFDDNSAMPWLYSVDSPVSDGLGTPSNSNQKVNDDPIPQLYGTPTDENTLITLIAMGLPSNIHLTERCVRSIRARGNFTGHILIFTDDGAP